MVLVFGGKGELKGQLKNVLVQSSLLCCCIVHLKALQAAWQHAQAHHLFVHMIYGRATDSYTGGCSEW